MVSEMETRKQKKWEARRRRKNVQPELSNTADSKDTVEVTNDKGVFIFYLLSVRWFIGQRLF